MKSLFKKFFSFIVVLMACCHSFAFATQHDLTVVGIVIYTEALGRLTIASMDSLKDDLKINFMPINNYQLIPDFVPPRVLNIINDPDRSYGNVSLFYHYPVKSIVDECSSKIKIFYTMTDSSDLPPGSGVRYNDCFDAMAVPDKCHIDIYRKSGVTIPIFVLPCPIYLEMFLNQSLDLKMPIGNPFVFGMSAEFVDRKNHGKTLMAFLQEFGNSPHVRLKMHGRWGDDRLLRERVKEWGANNIEIINRTFIQGEYVNFLTSLNAYVYMSMGEGFSITPREALACGIPCILSNNMAHTSICDSGFVSPVPSSILVPSYDCPSCIFYDCTVDDIREALREMYTNYEKHLKIAQAGKEWVRQFDHPMTRPYYLNLIKPKKVILGTENRIEKDFIMTNSLSLFNKYKELGAKE